MKRVRETVAIFGEVIGFLVVVFAVCAIVLVVSSLMTGCAATRVATVTPEAAKEPPAPTTTDFHGRFHIEYAFTVVRGVAFGADCNQEFRAEETIKDLMSEVPPDTVRIMSVHPDSVICGAKPKKTDGVVEGKVVVVYERLLTAKERAYVSERMSWLAPAPVPPKTAPKSKPTPKGKAKTRVFVAASR